MTINDVADVSIDPVYSYAVVLFNASPETQTFTLDDVIGYPLALHPVLAGSADEIVRGAAFDPITGTFSVPGRTTAVFVALEAALQ